MNGLQNNSNETEIKRITTERKAIEYGRDYKGPIKHYVRKNVWEPTAKKRLEKINSNNENRKLRYFTLCAEEAIDIRYFFSENLLESENGKDFPNTVYCECRKEPYLKIASNLGKTTGFLERFEDLVLQKNPKVSESFFEQFPFDVFNLDFTGFCFPSSDPPFSDTINAISKLIEVMGSYEQKKGFDILFTFRAEKRSEENEVAISTLLTNQRENIEAYPFYRDAVNEKGLNFTALVNSKYYEFLLYSLPKRIGKWGADAGFLVECPKSVFYPRPSPDNPLFYIISFVVSFDIPQKRRRFGKIQPELDTADPNLEIHAHYFNLLKQTITEVKQNIGTTVFNRNELEQEVKTLLEISENP